MALAGVALSIAVAVGGVALARTGSGSAASAATAPILEEAFQLRCLPAPEAAELMRPVLGLRENQVLVAPERAPHVVTVRATAAQLQEVHALLDRLEDPESAACRRASTAPPSP